MARTANGRMINQDIALSSKVASLSPEALALFCLLIPHLNSHGKMVANAYVVKGTVCPLVEWLPPEKIEACLLEISAKTNLKWWRDDRGLFYLHSLNWKEHQSLREDRLGPDHLPNFPGDVMPTPGIVPEYSRTNPAKGKVREVKVRREDNKPPDGFESFWSSYPKKQSRQTALKSWQKLSPDEALQKTILTAIERQKASTQWLKDGGQFIPMAATWLNGARWEDEPEPVRPAMPQADPNAHLPDWLKADLAAAGGAQ